MRQDPRLTRLTELADLIRDQRLEALRQANLRRQATEALIAGLEAPPAQDIPPLVAARAELAYQVWAERRRQDLARQLAQNIEACRMAQAEAKLAFGRSQVLGRLKDKT